MFRIRGLARGTSSHLQITNLMLIAYQLTTFFSHGPGWLVGGKTDHNGSKTPVEHPEVHQQVKLCRKFFWHFVAGGDFLRKTEQL